MLGRALSAALLVVGVPQAASAYTSTVGVHHCSVEGAQLVVESVYAVAEADPDIAEGLVEGLPEGLGSDDGVVIDVTVNYDRLVAVTRAPLGQVRALGVLPIPVVPGAGLAVHRMSFDPELRFVPDPALGAVAQLGYFASPQVTPALRREIEYELPDSGPRLGALYLTSDQIDATGGVRGSLHYRRDRLRVVAVVVGLAFVLVVGTLLVAYRRLQRRVDYERAEAMLDDEFDRLEEGDES